MNNVNLIGRLTRDPDIRYTQGENGFAVAKFTLAVNRPFKRDGEQEADFISCVTFRKTAEFVEKYLFQGSKIAVTGRIQTGSYTNRDGQKVYTTDVVVEHLEFAESARNNNGGQQQSQNTRQQAAPSNPDPDYGGFMNIPDGVDEDLPF